MAAPTRFPSGVTNAAPGTALGMMGFLDPSKYHMFFDDFDTLPIDAQWTLSATSGGAGDSVITIPDADGGIARITTAADENDGIFAEWDSETFLVEAGKKMWIKARLQVGDAIQSDLIVGLHSTDTSPLDATLRFAFISEDGSASVFFNVDDNSVDADSASVATLADDTFLTLGAYYDGKGNIQLFANDVHVTTMTGVAVPGAELAVGFGYLNGAAGAETTDLDYILVVKER
jgi:hypothetical protein